MMGGFNDLDYIANTKYNFLIKVTNQFGIVSKAYQLVLNFGIINGTA